MKSFHLSGPKFDIAAEMFFKVEFSNFLLGQKFVTIEFKNAKIGPKKANFVKGAQRPPLAMPNGTSTPVSHIILNGRM